MNNPSLLIVGCGDLGRRVARTLGQCDWMSTGVRRYPGTVSTDFPCRAADYFIPGSLNFAEALRPDYVLATFTPGSPDLAGYRRGFTAAAENLLAGLGEHRVKRLIMVSSTRVYAECAGAWVGEAGERSCEDERAFWHIFLRYLMRTSPYRPYITGLTISPRPPTASRPGWPE